MKIILSTPRGFCAGVFNAVDIVEKCLDTFGKPIYILKEIVHNKTVVDRLTQKGAHSIQSIEEAPENSYLVFSAHGVPPQFHQLAKNRNIKVKILYRSHRRFGCKFWNFTQLHKRIFGAKILVVVEIVYGHGVEQ
jgi:hypothetical protein